MDDARRELALRLAGALRGRRLYAAGARAAESLVERAHAQLALLLERAPEVSIGLLGEGVAVDGAPVTAPPPAVEVLAGRLSELGIEVLSFSRGVRGVEVEVVLDLLGLDAGALAGESLSAWLSARGCEHVRLRHLRLEDEAAPKDLRSSFRAATRELGGMFESAREGAAPSPDAVQRLARGLLDAALSAETPLSTLVALRDRDDRALVHSVNVACVVGAQARALGLPDAQVERLASAALTHDLGKVRVPEGVVQKQGGLTGQERALLARHTTEGARLLLAAGAELGAVVAFRHHRENAPDEPGLLAVELTKLADAFDGLRTLKPFSSAERRRGAVAWMARHLEARLNPYLLERFAKLLDVAPPGTYGWLTTGEVVKVVDVHRELALRPVVEVLDPRDGVLREGERVDLAVHAHQVGAPRFVPPVPERLARITVQDLDDLG